jgi:transposase
MTRKRSSFSPEFKDQMVKLYLELQAVKTVSQVARENGVGTETLRSWVNAYRVAHLAEDEPLTISERARLRELERENRELKLEKEFLGKATAFFAREYR